MNAEAAPLREWCVVASLANQDRKLVLSAELAGLEPYMPRYLDQRGRERILFLGYVFIKTPTDRESDLWTLKGAFEPVSFNGRAARLSHGAIDHFRAREQNGYITFDERFKSGEHVIVISGEFKNQIVLYRGMDREARETALFSLLGRDVVKAFDRHELASLDNV